jgi:hypothetical protein
MTASSRKIWCVLAKAARCCQPAQFLPLSASALSSATAHKQGKDAQRYRAEAAEQLR